MSRKLLYGVAAPVFAAVVAVAVSSIALLIAGESPRTTFLEMWKSIDSTASVVAIVNRAVPYYVAGVAVAIGFIMRLFNIGVDGQHQLAALFAAAFGFGIGSWGLPAPLYVASIFVVAVLVAMAWASIAAVLKVTRNVNEVISTIMLNFIASQLIFYLLRNYWNRSTSLVAETGPLPRGARIPNLNSWFEAIGFHFPANVILQGFLPIAIVIGIAYYVVLNRSRFGFDLRVSGENPAAAKASGINPKRMVLLTFLISGGIAGLIGLAPLLADPQYGKYGDQFPQGLGFTGLSLALLGRNHPIGIAAAALVWATIERATQRLSFIDIPQEIGIILQGSFLLAAVVAYEVVRRKAEAAETSAMARRTPVPTCAGAAPGRTAGCVGSDDVTAVTANGWNATASRGIRVPGPLWLWGALAAVLAMSITRAITDNDDLTSSGTMSVAIRTAAPIAMAGLAGLYAERSGTVNIGLEGMMILGTVMGGWWGWEYGPWGALLGGAVGGLFGGLLLALVTTTFGVNHIVAGFAINILAPGIARFMSTTLFVGEQGGSLTNSPGVTGDIGEFTMPFLAGGTLFGNETADALGRIDDWNWFVVSDVAGMLRGLVAGVRYDVLVGVGLFAATVFLLWHTRFGLRLRSAGEQPSAADSLGVRVHLYRYIGASISGALAGLGGAMLVISAGRYSQGQTVGKGFLGLATLVVGNWRPVGVAIGASIFGFFDGITQRLGPEELVLALLLAAALLLLAGAVFAFVTKGPTAMKLVAVGVSAFGVFVVLRAFFYELGGSVAFFLLWLVVGVAITTAGVIAASRSGGLAMAITAMAGVAALFVYLRLDEIPGEFVPMLPYVVTLVVVSSRGQALRPPAAAGEPWFKGQQ